MTSFTGRVVLSDGKTYDLAGDATEVTGGGGGGGGTPITGGAPIGNAQAGGGLLAAYDGNANKAASACARSQGSNPGWIGKFWSGAPKPVPSRFRLTGPNNARIGGLSSNLAGNVKLFGKVTGSIASLSDSALVLLFDHNFTEAAWPQVLDSDILGGWVLLTGSYESLIVVGTFSTGIADWNIAQQEWWS